MTRAPPPKLDVDRVRLRAFGLADALAPGRGAAHAHAVHQLLYAERGSLELRADGGRWLLPPARAAWISAGTRHEVRCLSEVSLRTVYFARGTKRVPETRCVVFAAPPLAREMILRAMAWGPADAERGPVAELFFRTLAAFAGAWACEGLPLRLPDAKSEPLRRVMDLLIERIAAPPSLAEAARVAAMSERSLARRFEEEAQTTYRAFVRQARMVRATELLAEPGARVTDVAFAVGFESPGAFTHAFRAFFGEAPRAFRADRRAR